MTKSKLPFDLTEEATAEWLQSLSQLNSINSANQLNKALLKLRKIEDEKVFQILIQLTPTIFLISHNIEASLLAEEDKTINKKTLKYKKLNIHLLRNLSMAFCAFIAKNALTTELENQAVYFSLQAIGYTQRITSLFQEFPSTTLWKKTAELYTFAKKRNIVSQEIKHTVKEFKALSDIETVIKRNLLFSILSPYRYASSHIKELFLISENYAHLVHLNQDFSVDYLYSWDPESESAPYNKINHQRSNSSAINIATEKFLSFIQSTDFSSKLEETDVLAQIIEALSGHKEIYNSAIPSEPIIYYVISGYSDITKYLESSNKLDKIQQLSSQLDDITPVKDIGLELMGFEKNNLTSESTLTSSNNGFDLPENAQAVKILHTKFKKYIIATSNTTDFSIGNIVLLFNSKVKPELGIVRQIKLTNTFNFTHILIEKIPGTPSSHLINSLETEEKQIILLQQQYSKPELILPLGKFANGTPIELAPEQTITLGKLIDYSPFYMHYLSY